MRQCIDFPKWSPSGCLQTSWSPLAKRTTKTKTWCCWPDDSIRTMETRLLLPWHPTWNSRLYFSQHPYEKTFESILPLYTGRQAVPTHNSQVSLFLLVLPYPHSPHRGLRECCFANLGFLSLSPLFFSSMFLSLAQKMCLALCGSTHSPSATTTTDLINNNSNKIIATTNILITLIFIYIFFIPSSPKDEFPGVKEIRKFELRPKLHFFFFEFLKFKHLSSID